MKKFFSIIALLLAISVLFVFGCKDPEVPVEPPGETEAPEKPGDNTETGENQPGDTGTGGNQSGDTGTGGNQPGDTETGGNQPDDTGTGGNQSGDNTETGGNQSGDNTGTGENQPGDNTESGGNQSGDNTGDNDDLDDVLVPNSITLTVSSGLVYVGETATVTSSVTLSDGSTVNPEITTTGKSTVSGNVLTANSVGTETITATYKGLSTSVNVKIKEKITNSILVHVPKNLNYTNAYAWIGESTKLLGDWPGTTMTDSDNDDYYEIEINQTSINIIFNGSGQTKDLIIESTGEYWYIGGKDGSGVFTSDFTDVDPTTSKDPVTSTENASGSGNDSSDDNQNSGDINQGGSSGDNNDDNENQGGSSGGSTGGESSDPIVTDYYWTNKDGAVGKNKTITIDGDSSDWTEDMKIVQNMANDDPRVYCPWAMHEMPIDLYSLYAAWDNDNLYLMFEFTNVQDIVATEDRDPLYNDLTSANLPIFLAFNTGASKSGNGKMDASGATLWDSGTTWDMAGGIDTVIVNSTKFNNGNWIYKVNSSGYLEEFAGAMGETDTVYTNGNNRKGSGKGKTTGINWARDQGIASKSIYGIKAVGGELAGRIAGDTEVATSANVVDFNTLGHDSDTYDLCYEVSIPFSQLGITKETLTSKGIGVSVIGTMGLSAMDCLPWSNSMIDVAADPYSQDGSTSAEKDDSDSITTPLARIGKM